ncbi:MAG: tryptophan synthase subunit alpha [Bacteroidetes bacterium]|nr:tryptophan synthase subunit alpha [Bacteroidota bacterium]
MKRLTSNFSTAEKVVIPYITPDYPVKGTTELLIAGLERQGVRIIELGIPFSDPLADGPTIQQSSMVALANGVNLDRVLELARWTYENTKIAVVLMGYVNPILRMGTRLFFEKAAAANVQGLIIPDIPQDEAEPFLKLADEFGLAMIFLVAPTTRPERISKISEASHLFSYCVSMNGVTGNQVLDAGFMKTTLNQVRQHHPKPFVVGFGIRSAQDVRAVLSEAKGAVIGSALIKELGAETTAEKAAQRGLNWFAPLAGVANEF